MENWLAVGPEKPWVASGRSKSIRRVVPVRLVPPIGTGARSAIKKGSVRSGPPALRVKRNELQEHAGVDRERKRGRYDLRAGRRGAGVAKYCSCESEGDTCG